jgi:Uma2 family endonuclease
MLAHPKPPLVSVQQYLEADRAADYRSEYDAGHVVAMAGASRNHNQLVANISAALINRLHDKPCNSYATDLRVAIQSAGRFYYPDLVIAWNPETYDDTLDPPALTNPVAILEVLSPSTEARDRGEKFLWYQTIPSLREYILVSQWPRRFEYFLRSDAGQWVYRGDLTNPQNLEVHAVQQRIAVEEVYNKVSEESA